MKRPWQVWLLFIVCVAGAAGAMIWLTQQALRADRLRRAAEAETDLEQRVSLALWRMDTELAPLVAEEVIRPPSAYRSVHLSPGLFQQRAVPPVQQQAVQQLAPPNDAQQQEPSQQAPNQQSAEPQVAQAPATLVQIAAPRPQWVPSALFTSPPSYVVLHFEARPDGTWHSPQVPEVIGDEPAADFGVAADVISRRKEQLKELANAVNLPSLIAELPDAPLPSVQPVEQQVTTDNSRSLTTTPEEELFGPSDNSEHFFEGNTANAESQSGEQVAGKDANPFSKFSKISKEADFQQRGARYQSVTKQSLMNRRQEEYGLNAPANSVQSFGEGDEELDDAQVGVSRPVWVSDKLLLARRVGSNGAAVVQGCWLDWSQLKERLLAEAADMLPGAELVQATSNGEDDPSRMLAGLPVRLVVNEHPSIGPISPTLGWSLGMGWGAAALAVLAAAALLHGVMTLSERRAAFVSSVTHELRTPLTTFRMYAEMLARGMVPNAEKRQEYYHTLQHEAERLTLLVENVLAYARLERGRKPAASDRVTLQSLLNRVGPRLAHRAAQADMKCDVQIDQHGAAHEFTTDQSVVEQILFNLVDNAAKYARSAEDRHIHVEGSRNGEWVKLVVRDHGPGIQPRKWTSRPFQKTAEESAESAPGVGLGLALCRRLAGQLGGRLEISSTPGNGTTATLKLPTSAV